MPEPVRSLEGKVALISGTAGGQGRAAAIAFAAAGARVVGCDVKVDEAKETVALVEAAGGEMRSLQPLDSSDPEQADAWVREAVQAYGGVDVLYNNAGSHRTRGPFAESALEDWEATLRFELTIAYVSTKAAWPHLIARGGGVIISTGSISGYQELPPLRTAAHGATKAGIIALTRMFAAEGAEHNIRAISISPGIVRSPVTERFWTGDEAARAAGAAMVAKIPLGRAAECSEIASVAVFLASPGAAYINATDIVVDGGLLGVSTHHK